MEEFIKCPQILLTLAGYWPKENIKHPWLYNLHLLISTYLISYLYIFTLTYDLYVNIDNPGVLVSGSYYCITIFAFNVKFLLFTFKRKRFINLLHQLQNPLFQSERQKLAKSWLTSAKRYTYVYSFCCSMCWVMYTFLPLFDMKNLRLPVRGWFPYDPKSSTFVFILTFLFQSFGQLIAIMVNVSLDLLPSLFMNIACVQIDVLKDDINNAIMKAESKQLNSIVCVALSKEAEDTLFHILRDCVVYHKFILKFLDEINSIFSIIFFTQIVASGCSLCITGLQLIVMNANKLETINVAIYLLGITMQFSLYCWNGHHVIVQTSSIGDNCYNMDWYRCSTRIKKILFLIMERCKKPTQINADYFFVMSIETMTAVLRNSYSYFAVLRSIYGE